MPKTHSIYNQVALFVGPSPSTGYHCITNYGLLNTNIPSDENFNLIFPIQRTINTNYSFAPSRIDIQELGTQGYLANPILNENLISLNFSYYQMGLINEVRLGLMANIPSGHSVTGNMLYGTGKVPILSGLYNRDFERSNESLLNWPLKSRDSRNFFAICKKDYLDSNDYNYNSIIKNNNQFYTIAFGDCYLSSYSTSCSINQLPQCNVSYICNNLMVYDGTSGFYIPSIDTRTQNSNSGVVFYIPNNFEGTGNPTVVIPSDINLSINQTGGNVSDLINNFNDIKIQSYSLSFQLNRESLYNIGYKYAMDRLINLPIVALFSFDTIPGDNTSSSFINLLRNDNTYNFSIKLNYQSNTRNFTGLGIVYDIVGAKFQGFNESISISNKKTNTYNFSVELKPDDLTNGLFISGFLGVLSRTGYITYLSGQNGSGYILDSGNNKIQISTAEYIPLY